MAPAVSFSKCVVRPWQSPPSAVPHKHHTRAIPQSLDRKAKFTCEGAKRLSHSGESIHKDDSFPAEHMCQFILTPFISRDKGAETTSSSIECPPVKKRRLWYIPVRSDISDVELAWHAKNIEDLLKNGDPSCSESTGIKSNVLADSDKSTPRVLIFRGGKQILPRIHDHGIENVELAGISQFQTSGNSNSEVIEVPEVVTPAAPASSLNLTNVCVEGSPPLPGPFNPQISASHPDSESVDEHPSQCLATTNQQTRDLDNLNDKCCWNVTSFNIKAISKNLNFDGRVSSRTSSTCGIHEELNPVVHPVCEVPVKPAEVDSGRADPSDLAAPAKSKESDLKPPPKPKKFHFRTIAENLDVNGCIGSKDIFHTPADKYAVTCNYQVPARDRGSFDVFPYPIQENLRIPTTAGSQEGPAVDDSTESSNAKNDLQNDVVQNEQGDSQEAMGSDFDIPTVVQEFISDSASDSSRSKRKNKRKRKRRRKCLKRARVQFSEPSSSVTEYTSLIGWVGGKMTISKPKSSKVKGAQPGRIDVDESVSAESLDSHGGSGGVQGCGNICFDLKEDIGDVEAARRGDPGEITVDVPTNLSADDPAANAPKNNECSNNNTETNESRFSDAEAVEALLFLKNHLSEKVAKTDAKLIEESEGNAEQVVDYSCLQAMDSPGNLSCLDPDSADDQPGPLGKITDTDKNVLSSKLEWNEKLAELDTESSNMSGEKEDYDGGALSGPQEYDSSLEYMSFVNENAINQTVSFSSYLHSLIRPQGFPGHPYMKMKCMLCGKLVSWFEELEQHCIKSHRELWENIIRSAYLRVLVPYLWEGFLEDHPELKFKCAFCSQLFICHGDLKNHLNERHSGDDPYQCPFCNERFRTDSSYSFHLGEHIRKNDYPTFPCNACSACFSTLWELDLHSHAHKSY